MKYRKSLEKLKRVMNEKLEEVIIGNEKIARVAIVYDPGQYQIFPPALAMANHEDIEEFYPLDDFYESIWNPAEFPVYARPTLLFKKKEDEFFRQLNKEYKKKPIIENDAIEIYVDCSISAICFARALGKDVIVFCTDPELTHLRRNVNNIKDSVNDLDAVFPSWLK